MLSRLHILSLSCYNGHLSTRQTNQLPTSITRHPLPTIIPQWDPADAEIKAHSAVLLPSKLCVCFFFSFLFCFTALLSFFLFSYSSFWKLLCVVFFLSFCCCCVHLLFVCERFIVGISLMTVWTFFFFFHASRASTGVAHIQFLT